MKLLLSEATANTTGTQTVVDFTSNIYNGGKASVIAFGTWGGATITLQFSPDGGTTWYAVGTSTTFTANGWATFEIHGRVKIRASLTNAGTTSLSIGIL